MKAAEAAREKLVGDVVRENKRLAEPLQQVNGAGWGAGRGGAGRLPDDQAAREPCRALLITLVLACHVSVGLAQLCRQANL